MERRRATRRNLDEWSARYRLGATEWQACRLIDLAKTGATLEPVAPLDNDSPSGETEMQFKLPGIDEVIELLGDIRHTTQMSPRFGLRTVPPTPTTRRPGVASPRTVTDASSVSSPSIATAVCDRLCGSTPIITTMNTSRSHFVEGQGGHS